MDANGCDQIELPVPKGKYASEPSWSADGEKIAFWYPAEDGGLYVTNADGTGTPKKLATPGLFPARPEWSPDGTQIAFQSNDHIYIMDVSPEGNTSRPQQLTDDEHLSAGDPSWSPDGTEIAFSSSGDIYKIDVNTLKETRLTHSPPYDSEQPTWSPDGKQIAYVKSGALYKMGADGSNPTPVFRVEGEAAANPDWGSRP